MPIYGTDNNQIILEFGFGDLVPCVLVTRDEHKPDTLAFVEIEEQGEIGRPILIGPHSNITPVLLVFSDVRSVDIVIERLEELKSRLEEFNNGIVEESPAPATSISPDSEY